MFMALEYFNLYAMERIVFMFMAFEDFDLYAMERIVFYVYGFGMLLPVKVRDLAMKAIWEFTHKYVLAANDVERVALKHSKGFILVLFLQ